MVLETSFFDLNGLNSHKDESCGEKLVNWTALAGFAGAFAGSAQSSWNRPKLADEKLPTFRQQFRVMGKSSLVFATAAASFVAGECAVESIRHKKDHLNSIGGGMMTGVFAGMYHGSFARAFKTAGAVSAIMCFSAYMLDEYETPMQVWQKNRTRRQEAIDAVEE